MGIATEIYKKRQKEKSTLSHGSASTDNSDRENKSGGIATQIYRQRKAQKIVPIRFTDGVTRNVPQSAFDEIRADIKKPTAQSVRRDIAFAKDFTESFGARAGAKMADEEALQQAEDFAAFKDYDVEAAKAQLNDTDYWMDKLRHGHENGMGFDIEKQVRSEWQKLGDEIAKAEAYQRRVQKQNEYNAGLAPFLEIKSSPDFEAKSRYVSTKTAEEPKFNSLTGRYVNSGYGDEKYELINQNEDAWEKHEVNSISDNSAFLGLDNGYLKYVNDEERAIFNAHYMNDPNKAYEFIEYIKPELTARQRKAEETRYALEAYKHPVMSSIASIAEGPLKGLSLLGQIADAAAGNEIDPNAAYNRPVYSSNAMREEVSGIAESSWGPIGSFAYQTGMSMGDFLYSSAITGGNQALSLAVMGTGAAADTTMRARERGVDSESALVLGAIAGVAEIAMERLSFDALFGKGELTDGALRYILKNALTEGGEEASTSIINIAADIILSRDKSEWQRAVDSYMLDGNKTKEQAFMSAFIDQLESVGMDFLGGAVSGSAMATPIAGMNAIATRKNTVAEGAENVTSYNTAEASLYDVNKAPSEFLAAVDNELVSFVKKVENNAEDAPTSYTFGATTERLNADIKELTGIDTTSYSHSIGKNSIRHILKNHGKNGKTDRTMANNDDIARIGYVLNNYDGIELVDDVSKEYRDKNQKPAPMVRLSKQVDGTIYVVEAVPETKAKKLAVVTTYIKKPSQQTRDVQAPLSIVRNASADNGSMNSISKNEPIVNGNISDVGSAFGESGSKAIRTSIPNPTPGQYEAFAVVYNANLNGRELTPAQAEKAAVLTPEARYAAEASGKNDADRAAQAVYFGENAGLVRDDNFKRANLKSRDVRVLDAVAKVTGTQIRFAPQVDEGRANADYKSGVIEIAMDATDPVKTAMLHEVVHRLREIDPESYQALAKFVAENMNSESFATVLKVRQAQYNKGNSSADIDFVTEEAVADAFGVVMGDSKLLDKLVADDRTTWQRICDILHDFILSIKQALRKDSNARLTETQKEEFRELQKSFEEMEKVLRDALDRTAAKVQRNTSETQQAQKNTAGAVKYSVRREFAAEIDAWDGKKERTFNVGSTSEALQSIGVQNRKIIWHSRKIAEILRKHKNMTREVIKQVPQIMESPIIVLKSQNSDSRITIFGEVTDTMGNPVLAVLELEPTAGSGRLLNMNIIASAYGKDSNPAGFIKNSELLYLDTNKNRTNRWLNAVGLQLPSVASVHRDERQGLGLQLPSDTTHLGSIGTITYNDGKVNIKGVPYEQYMQSSEENSGKDKTEIKQGLEFGQASETQQAQKSTAGAVGDGIRFSKKGSDEELSIKQQMKQYLDELNDMEIVVSVNGRGIDERNKTRLKQDIIDELKPTGYQVDRKGFGKILFAEKEIKGALGYLRSDAEIAAFKALPRVLKRGVQVGAHENHKTRGYDTVTIAAPIELNGKRANMAVVVKLETNNEYKVHRIVAPDGGRFEFGQIRDAEPTPSSVLDSQENEQNLPISSASEHSISNSDENVNSKFSRKWNEEKAGEIQELRRENERQREMIAHLRGQMKRRVPGEVDAKAVNRAARELIRSYGGTISADEISGEIKVLYDDIGTGRELDYNEIRRRAQNIARTIAESAAERDDTLYQEYAELRRFARNTEFIISESDRSNIPGFEDFRRRNIGRIRIKYGKTNIDSLYRELQEMFPEYFNEEEVSHPADQLMRIADVLDDVYTVVENNPFASHMGYAVEMIGNDILERFYNVPQVKRTFADRAAERLERTVIETDAKVRRVEEHLAEYRENTEKRLSKFKEEQRGEKKEFYKKQRERELRARIVRATNKLSQQLRWATDKKHISNELQGAVARFLEAVNLTGMYTYDEKGKLRRSPDGAPTKKSLAFEELRAIYKKFDGELVFASEFFEGVYENGEVRGDILNRVLALRDTRVAEMTEEQLRVVLQGVQIVETAVKSADKLFSSSRFSEISSLAENVRDNAPIRDKMTISKLAALGKNLFDMGNLTPEAFLHRLGKGGDEIFRMLSRAEGRKNEIAKEVEAFTRKLIEGSERKQLEREVKKVTLGGEEVEMSVAQIMELYALSRRKQAENHLLEGGITLEAIPGKNGEKRRTPIKDITELEIGKAIDLLTLEQKKLAEKLSGFASKTLGEYMNEACLRVFGYKKFGEENYWTIRVDPTTVHKQSDTADAVTGTPTIRNYGMAKATTHGANNALLIGSIFDTFSSHAAQAETYAAYLGVTEDLRRLINFTFRDESGKNIEGMQNVLDGVFGIIETKDGDGKKRDRHLGIEYWNKLYEDINGGMRQKDGETPFDRFFRNSKIASVAGNARVVIQQPTAILRAGAEIDYKYLIAGMAHASRGWKRALKYAPIAQQKAWGRVDISTGRTMKEMLFGADGVRSKIQDKSMSLASAADAWAWGSLWSACEFELRAENENLRVGSDALYYAVAERFTDIVNKTQVVDGVLQRSQNMRSSNVLAKMATVFMSEPTKQYNMLVSAVYDFRHAEDAAARVAARKKLGRVMFSLILSNVVNAAAQSLIDALRDDDREKDYWEKWFDAFIGTPGEDDDTLWKKFMAIADGNLAGAFNPLGYFPYVKELWSFVQGYDVKRMDIESVADFVTASGNALNALSGNGKETAVSGVNNLIAAGATLYGIPYASLKRDVGAAVRTVIHWADNSLLDYRVEKLTTNIKYERNGKVFYDILYRAMKHDREAYEIIYADMVKSGIDEKKIKSAMEDRMKEEQGVKKVTELSKRYLSPTQEKAYDRELSAVQRSPLWSRATAKQKKALETDLYNVTVQNDNGQKLRDKMYAAEKYGIDTTEYLLYLLACDIVDKPNESGKLGSITQDEFKEAVKMVGLSRKERNYLWEANS